jgi:hypothetical protein
MSCAPEAMDPGVMEKPELNEGEVTNEDEDEEVDPDDLGWLWQSQTEVRTAHKLEMALDLKALERHRITWGRGVHNIGQEHQPFHGADMALSHPGNDGRCRAKHESDFCWDGGL